MKFVDLFLLSIRMFKARPSRTLLTILGMSIGIGAILFLVSFGYGLQKTLLERITTSDSLLTLDVSEAKSGLVSLDRNVISEIESLEGVEDVSPAFRVTSQGQVGDISADLISVGIKPSFLKLGGIRISEGETLNDQNTHGIIISSAVANVFGKASQEEMLGEKIKFSFFILQEESQINEGIQSNFRKIDSEEEYEVIGIIEGEENVVYINSASLGILDIDRFTQAKVKCRNQEIMGSVRDNILEKGLLVSSLSETVEQANQIFKIIQLVLMLFGIIALIVSAIGMFNTMTIALLERTEEIGIMKSIGATDMSVSLMFVMESSIMGFLGGIGGVMMGFLSGKGFNMIINFIASRLGGEAVSLFYSPLWFVMMIIVFAAIVGFITGFIPARRASNIDPLDALRYK